MNFGDKAKIRITELKISLDNVSEKIEQASIDEDTVGLISLDDIYRDIVLEIEELNDIINPRVNLV